MEAQKVRDILKKETRFPRNILHVTLYASFIAMLGLGYLVLLFVVEARKRKYDAQSLATFAGTEMARQDVKLGQPKSLKISYVQIADRSTGQLENTQQKLNDLDIWEWRYVAVWTKVSSPTAEAFATAYNDEVARLRGK